MENKIFTIGEMTNFGKITGFEIHDNIMRVIFGESGDWQNIDVLRKPKPKVPLFTTEDGFQKFKGDDCYYINQTNNIFQCPRLFEPSNLSKIKYFHREDAAKEWLILNKPIEVSYKDISDFLILMDYESMQHYEQVETLNNLKSFFKSKINP